MPGTVLNLPEILLTDTFSGKKVPLATLVPGAVGIYCCGPTVYDLSHVGHARAALVPDVIVRFLRAQGYRVKYVRNITDIDDKIIARAQRDGIAAADVAERFAAEYHRDLDALGMLRPDVEPRVSEHLPEIVALVENLVAKGLAYVVGGDVYYRVAAFHLYGRLSGRNRAELLDGAGSRVEVDERKESPLDFALWKAAKPGEPAWDSPWGPGRPGWHIECSVMSSTHLGTSFDIHCGGRDLIFPHHENEIAQSQGAYGEHTFARYWVHNGFINFAGEKMSKSLGNVWTIRQVLDLYPAETLRYFLLTVHYRTGLNFEIEERATGVRFPGLEDADDRVAYVYETLAGARGELGVASGSDAAGGISPGEVTPGVADLAAAFAEAMRNDFNTPAALGVLSKPLAEVNGLIGSGKGVARDVRRRTLARFLADLRTVSAVLGCFGQAPATFLATRRDLKAARMGLDTARVERLVAERGAARAARDWAAADRLRDELAALGVAVKDGPAGSVWSL
ncbi:MAG TPA: cysteine--tRNA ligase [Candidatus Krumholzibacteria bacterium]|nr:cysteine--tRNA ligase [Candidatus Krumholzibacteria bacterium]HPD72532.1 cysteine--tRNA ligase [Candidatus Krumholzibacteria bacterium]HRY40536.1 cysteine--tRNA ligase [Candidatus Krumholzibacteria bacterium]